MNVSEKVLYYMKRRMLKERITELVVFISLGSIFGIEMVVGLLK